MYQFKNMFLSLIIVCYLVLIRITIYASWVVDDEGCRTPDQGVGNCILARNCKSLTDFLVRVPQPVSKEIKVELLKYQCGYNDGVKVCCPSYPINMSISTEAPDSSPPPPPDITNHKNFHLLPTECGYLGNPDKIRNGKDAKLNEFPWMALLSYNTSRGLRFKCGGTILNKRYILTAAHCLSNLTSPLTGVRVGEHKISTRRDCETLDNGKEHCSELPVQDLYIEDIIIHPGYSRTIVDNDIGLLRVAEINTAVENVRPVCLPTDEETRNAKFNYCVVTGWGYLDDRGTEADVLQKVDLPITNFTECKEVYKEHKEVNVSHKQICAGGKNKQDSCPGDSGGPMQVATFVNNEIRYVQQGIVSLGHKYCGTEGYPGVYTRIAYFMDWILDNIKP